MLIGTSLKMYFSHERTQQWVGEVAQSLREGRTNGADIETFVIPQFPSIHAAKDKASGSQLHLGAQDLATEDGGAFTGEVSGAVLAELGCRYVEVGHAERRRLFGETDEIVAAKVASALRNRMVPILCVGEAIEQGAAAAITECIRQIESGLTQARAAGLFGEVVIAYEPLWAIGAPAPASADYIREVCSAVRGAYAHSTHKFSVIYGGSAGPGLLPRIADSVDGIFLGRFVHDPSAFLEIIDEAVQLQTS